jgi:hypothetical protein
MACETEFGDALAAVPALAVCATAETGIGAAACAAAIWNYYKRLDALNKCQQANGLASLDAQVNQIYAEAQYMQGLAESAGQTVAV